MRYSGSKKRYAKELISIMLKDIKNDQWYVEPFAGGMNILSEVPHILKIGSDINKYVVSMWQKIQEGEWIPPQEVTKDEYYDIKESYINKDHYHSDWVIGYVGNCCSNGSAWWNGYANFNPKKNENHVLEAYNGIMKQIDNFKFFDETIFLNQSYDKIDYPHNSIIFCDPPYVNTKKYENDFDTVKFWDWVRRMIVQGHKVYITEYTAPDDFICIWHKAKKDGMKGAINGNKQDIKIEKLFIHKSQIFMHGK